jgi:hypothetical protein
MRAPTVRRSARPPWAAWRRSMSGILVPCEDVRHWLLSRGAKDELPQPRRPGRAQGTRELAAVRLYFVGYRVTPVAVEIVRVGHMTQSRR